MEHQPEAARLLAKDAYDAAIADLNTVSVETARECRPILQHLRDNLSIFNESSHQ